MHLGESQKSLISHGLDFGRNARPGQVRHISPPPPGWRHSPSSVEAIAFDVSDSRIEMAKGKSKAAPRARPNVLITGTPGTGKSSLAERVAAAAGMTQYDVSATAKAEKMVEEYDEEMDTHVIDEDAVLDHMEERLGTNDGGFVVDYHSCDLFPERWFDLVVVLTCDNSTLYDRLEARGYKASKITKNVECEIFQAVVEEARESYAEEIVRVCPSNDIEEMEMNEKHVVEWIAAWGK